MLLCSKLLRNILILALFLAIHSSSKAQPQPQPTPKQSSATGEVPTVDFCEMVTHPELYFDRTIRITAAYQLGVEGSNLNNVLCVRSHDDSIGVGFEPRDETHTKLINTEVRKIRSGKFGPQPRVTVVGRLRNQSRRSFAWYRYRFDIIRFEDIRDDVTERIVSYSDSLQKGITYRGRVKSDETSGLALMSPVRIPPHHAVSLEWINLTEFPLLQRLSAQSEKQIIFRVMEDKLNPVEPNRWNRTFRLKILLIE
ncbi:MAG TPA: hypothetical protein VFX97_14900 [Pyrinomonadaceae bacterium]|nr:hypothetical protein [Pyrinomonadaceae bacterium]